MLTVVASEQIAVRLSEDLVARLDDLVTEGTYESRAAAVRAGIEAVIELERRRRVDRAVVDGYRRIPPGDAEAAAGLASLRDAIREEPW
jgi:Arc/MetJ-type ribon-helix-helix transcriptional regulator